MQKQTSKYILSMLIATMLLLSMLPVIPVSAQALVLTPNTGSPGDKILVSGTNFDPEVDVPIYWDLPSAENVLNTTDIGGSRAFDAYVTIPPTVVGSDHYIIVKGVSAQFTVTPSLTLTPDTGLLDDTITAEGHGFADEEEVTLVWNPGAVTLVTDPTTVETDVNGSFTCTFDVPSPGTYGAYTVTATDALANSDVADFTIGATITLDVVEGPSGTIVEVDGRGFTDTSGLAMTIGIRNGTGAPPSYVLIWAAEVDDIETESDGTFSGEFIIPTLSVGTYDVNATDAEVTGNVTSGDVEFEVTGQTGITVEPVSGVPLSEVVLEGINFTAIANTEVDINFIDTEPAIDRVVAVSGTYDTNATGGIEPVTFVVPDHPDLPIRVAKYVIQVIDENGLQANASFRIVRTRAFVDPEEGPSGGAVDVWVEGLTGDANYNITIGGELMIGTPAEGVLNTDGKFATGDNWVSVWVPTMDVDTYDVVVMDEDGVTASVPFDVTDTTELILSPAGGPPLYNITVEANYYTADAGINIEIIIYNLTAGGEVDWDANLITISPEKYAEDGFTLVKTNGTGFFRGSFKVPEDDAGDAIVLGDYLINATDANDLGVWELDFSIVAVTVEVNTVRSTYAQGEDVTFRVRSTFPSQGTIEVMDADGFNYTVTIKEGLKADGGDYQEIGDDFFAYPFMELTTDDPIGTYHWTADVSESIRRGTFEVVESTAGVLLIERINDLEEDLAQLSDAVGAVRTSLTGVQTDVGTVEGYVDELEADLADVSAAVSGISASAAAAEAAATDAKNAAEAANTTASGISMAVYGSMALSLIAALAAIAAVLTLQRKVAG